MTAPFRTFAVLLAAFLALTCVANETGASQGIDFPAFSSTAGLALNGAAAVAGGRLRLCPAAGRTWVSGSAWYAGKVHVAAGFTTTFTFQLTEQDDFLGGGDGFAFVIQNSGANAVGTAGRGLGYGGGDGGEGGIPNSVAVEFDTYENADDPDDNHVSVHTRGTAPNSDREEFSIGRTSSIPPLKDGTVHTGRVEYAGGLLSVYVDDLSKPALVVAADLSDILQLEAGTAYIGFTSSVATARENHDVLSWSASMVGSVYGPPQGLAATAVSPTQIDLSWLPAGAGVTGINVERKSGGGSFMPLTSLDGTATSYRDSGLSPATTYAYRARTLSAVGASDYSVEARAMTLPLQGARAVLLVHGTWSDASTWNRSMTGAIRSLGCIVEAVDFPTEPETLSNETYIELQATALARRIRELMVRTGERQVSLVCHSMGGLAARFYLTHSKLWPRDVNGRSFSAVSKAILLGTPNLGTDGELVDPVGTVTVARLWGVNVVDGERRGALDTHEAWSPAVREMFAEWEPPPQKKGGKRYQYPPGFLLAQWPAPGPDGPVSPLQDQSYSFAKVIRTYLAVSGETDAAAAISAVIAAFPPHPGVGVTHVAYYEKQARKMGVWVRSGRSGVVGVGRRRVSKFLAGLNATIDVSGARIYLAAGDVPLAWEWNDLGIPSPFNSGVEIGQIRNDGVVPTDSALGRDPLSGQVLYPEARRALLGLAHMDLTNAPSAVAQVVTWLREP